MRRATITVSLAAFCVALIVAGPGSAAAPHNRVVHRKASFSFEAHLPSVDGYALYLRAKNHRRIELDVEREPFAEPYVTMTYLATGRVGRDGIKADLGRFGQVDLHFVGKPQEERFHHANCTPAAPSVTRYGALRGTFEFESLDRKVKLSTRKVEGQTDEAPALTCRPKRRLEEEGGEQVSERPSGAQAHWNEEGFVTDFSALAHAGGRTIEIYAIKLNNEIVPDMAATSNRRYGPVLLSTTVHAPESEEEVPGEAGGFSITGKGTRPRHATLSAPSPFSGTGTYVHKPGSRPTFLGSLAVQIPGEGAVSLAGPEFRAALCNFAVARHQQACERKAGPAHTA